MKKYLSLAAAASALVVSGQANAVTLFGAQGSGVLIPLGVNTQTSTATVNTTGQITSLVFTLDLLAHASARDLTATITHDGITATLFSNLDSRGLFGTYIFSSGAKTSMANDSGFLTYAPGVFSFSYPVAGSTFLGDSAAGDWTLSITDSRRQDGGFLTGWSVSGTAAPAVPEPATWAMLLVGFAAVGAVMRRRNQVQQVRVSFGA